MVEMKILRKNWNGQKKMISDGKFTVPSTIGDEKSTNPFMRVGESALQKHSGTQDPVQVMKFLRDEKNNFKAKQ